MGGSAAKGKTRPAQGLLGKIVGVLNNSRTGRWALLECVRFPYCLLILLPKLEILGILPPRIGLHQVGRSPY